MKVTGFSFIRNAVKYDYPVVEAIKSILPVCDDFVVAVGKSDDCTRNLIADIDRQKIRILDTEWDDTLRLSGRVLAAETDKALACVPSDSDWAFYIQGDEAVHEKYLDNIYSAMTRWKDDKKIDGLLFKYLHFYGSYDYVGESMSWYRREIRIIRNTGKIYSYKDAQGFRKKDNKKLNVKLIDAYIYHYGWVKHPSAMQGKVKSFNRYWHDDAWISSNVKDAAEFDYSGINALRLFDGTHPAVMLKRIKEKNWNFDYDISCNRYSFKEKIRRKIEKITGCRAGEYRNYRLV
jgi:hypothetical protein